MSLLLSESQRNALVSLRAIFGDRQCVLIGATALGSQIKMKRNTNDVDLAVVVPVEDMKPLLEGGGWRQDAKLQHRWYSKENEVADILPATNDLIARGEVRFDGDAVRMSLVGFDLALRHTTREPLLGTSTEIEVATWQVILVLKIVAWLDRPAERGRDLGDIAATLDQALGDSDPRRWDANEPVFASGLDHEDHSAFFAGLEVARIIAASHREVIDRFLALVVDPESVWFAKMLAEARYVGVEPEAILSRRLSAFRRGLDHQ